MFIYYTLRKIVRLFIFTVFIFAMVSYFGGTDIFKRGVDSVSTQTQQVTAIPQELQNKINNLNLPAPVKDVISRVKNLDPTGEESGGSDNPWGY